MAFEKSWSVSGIGRYLISPKYPLNWLANHSFLCLFQVHPVVDARQTVICYEKSTSPNTNDYHTQATNNRRPGTPPPQNTCYPLAPNICVEAGRIQFVRREPDGAQIHPQPPPSTVDGDRNTNSTGRLSNSGTIPQTQQSRVTVTRGLQTDWIEDEEEADLREMQVGGVQFLLVIKKNSMQEWTTKTIGIPDISGQNFTS